MGICFKCGEESSKLFGVVVNEGIVEVCCDCVEDDEVAFVQKSCVDVLDNSNEKKSVYERLSCIAGINPDEHKGFGDKSDEEVKEQDKDLIEIVNKNSLIPSVDISSDLVRNFHWIVMRSRRFRKMTLTELSKKISVSEEVLKMIENGIVSEKDFEVIKKLELFLGIQILTSEAKNKIKSLSENKIGFDSITTRSITIEDLKEIQEKRESEIFENPKPELTEDDFHDIIFGRK